jgi:hypothetical protein
VLFSDNVLSTKGLVDTIGKFSPMPDENSTRSGIIDYNAIYMSNKISCRVLVLRMAIILRTLRVARLPVLRMANRESYMR